MDMSKLTCTIDALNLDNVKEAFRVANNAIYFDDNSDYQTALYQVCKALCPNVADEEFGKKYIEEDKEDK